MSDLVRRVWRLERSAAGAKHPPAVDLAVVYRRLEAVGLARWDPLKGSWSPADPQELRALLAERQGR